MATQERSFIGKGPLYIGLYGAATDELVPIGNCSALEISFDQEEISQADYTTAGGGTRNKVTRVNDVTGSLTMTDFTSANLALALRGTAIAQTVTTVTGEAHATTGEDGSFVPFDFQFDASEAVTVTLTDSSPCVEGTDYTLGNAGIIIIGTGNIGASGILVSYTKAAGEILEALTSSALEYRVVYDGINEAQGGKPFTVEMYRVKFSPVQGLGLIGDAFGEMPLDFTALTDTSKSGAGISQVMKVKQVV